jgi:vacuolar-type H+-ATPase subunit I/STV1
MKIKDFLKDIFTNRGEMDHFPTPYIIAIAILITAASVGADYKHEWHTLSAGDIIIIALFAILKVGACCMLLGLLWGTIQYWWKERTTTSLLLILLIILIATYKLLGF